MHGLLKKIINISILLANLGVCCAEVALPAPVLVNHSSALMLAALPQPSSASTGSQTSTILPEPSEGSGSVMNKQVIDANNAAVGRPSSPTPRPLSATLLSAVADSNPLPPDLRLSAQQLAQNPLPNPVGTSHKPLTLSLNEAILLDLRNDPLVIGAELSRVTQKFALLVAHWQTWEPQYALSGTVNVPTNAGNTYGIGAASVTATTPVGTVLSAGYTQASVFGGAAGGTGFSVVQPLLKGFGWAFNTAGWYSALDAEETNKLNYKGTVIAEVVQTITNYRSLVQNYAQLEVQKQQLAATKTSLDQLALKLKAGQESKSNYIQQKAQYESQLVQYVTAQQNIETSYYQFLQGLGLDPTAKVVIEKNIVVNDFSIPPMQKAIDAALQGNIPYQVQLIALRTLQRNLITAKNNALWTLTATYTAGLGNSSAANGGGSNVSLAWTIPINALNLKQGIVNAQVALEQGEITLANLKRNTINQVMTQIIQLHSQYQAIKLAQEQVKLQLLTVNNTRLKLKYGQSTVFELNTEQQNLINAQTSLISAEITFENNLTSLYAFLGLTLDRWRIKLRY